MRTAAHVGSWIADSSVRGQSALEYVILVVMIIFAVVGLQTYLNFASAGRIKSASDNLSPILVNPDGGEVAFQDCRLSSDDSTNPLVPGPVPGTFVKLYGQQRAVVSEQQRQLSGLSGSIPSLPSCSLGPS